MLQQLDTMLNNSDSVTTLTENGALTLAGSGSKCLDLFAAIGAWRSKEPEYIEDNFAEAFKEDKLLALRILFFARDVRGGLGERRTFRVILQWLARSCPQVLRANLQYVPFFGRFDDVLELLDTELRPDVTALIKEQLEADLKALEENKPISLLGKWLPSSNTSSKKSVRYANRIAKELGWKISDYRKTLSRLRRAIDIVETYICKSQYTFDFAKLPGQALKRYNRLFLRKDKERYSAYLQSVGSGEAKMNTGTLLPCDIVYRIMQMFWGNGGQAEREAERAALDTMWKQLPDFTNSGNNIAVVDTSGSMTCHCAGNSSMRPIDVAVSLGLYFAEHNTGCFHNAFLTFSAQPSLIKVEGNDIYAKVQKCLKANWGNNTDVQAVFNVILKAALAKKAPQEELPQTIFIISDMEFDDCTRNASVTNFEQAKCAYERSGYKLPSVVFWNVCARNKQVPVNRNEQGAALVSGYTPRLFAQIFDIAGKTPMDLMLEIIGAQRYQCITLPEETTQA